MVWLLLFRIAFLFCLIISQPLRKTSFLANLTNSSLILLLITHVTNTHVLVFMKICPLGFNSQCFHGGGICDAQSLRTTSGAAPAIILRVSIVTVCITNCRCHLPILHLHNCWHYHRYITVRAQTGICLPSLRTKCPSTELHAVTVDRSIKLPSCLMVLICTRYWYEVAGHTWLLVVDWVLIGTRSLEAGTSCHALQVLHLTRCYWRLPDKCIKLDFDFTYGIHAD